MFFNGLILSSVQIIFVIYLCAFDDIKFMIGSMRKQNMEGTRKETKV